MRCRASAPVFGRVQGGIEMTRRFTITAAVTALCLCTALQAWAFSFYPGHYYATLFDGNIITQFDSHGAIKDSISIPMDSFGYSLRGLAFGPDGRLYVTVAQEQQFTVMAINSRGKVLQSYTHRSNISGCITLGRICFDNAGHFYVGTMAGVVRFTVASPSSAEVIYKDEGIQDLISLATGNLLIASNSKIFEITPSGKKVREILLSDPNHLVTDARVYFTDIRGIEYDPASNSLFVTALGHSGFFHKLMRLDATTGVLLGVTTVTQGLDLCLSKNNWLIVGNRFDSPTVLSTQLKQLGTFEGNAYTFITQYTAAPQKPAN